MCPLTNPSIGNIFSYGTCVISKAIIPLIFALAIALFVWGVVKFFIINVDEEAKRSQGKQFMIWGIIALVAISSVWGLVRIFGKTFGLNTQFLPGVRPRGSGVGNSNEDFIPEPVFNNSPTTGSGGGGGLGGTRDPLDPCGPFYTMCDSTNLPP